MNFQQIKFKNIEKLIISQANSDDLKECLLLYNTAFPSNERHADEVIIERVSSGSSKLFVAKSDRQFSGFALVHDLVLMPYVLLDYLAVNGTARKNGIGSSILNFIAEYFKRDGKCLVVESENPDFGDNKEERAKRIDFYLKNGGEIIQNVQYLLPPLDGTFHTEMKLILFNPKVEGINQSELKELISNIYLQIYKRGLEDKYLLSILESIK